MEGKYYGINIKNKYYSIGAKKNLCGEKKY